MNKTLHQQFQIATENIAGKKRWDWSKRRALKKTKQWC